jgi:hypothetical protein
MQSARYCHILMNFEFYRQIFEKHSNTNHKNLFGGSRFAPDGRTNEADSRRSHFCEQAWNPYQNIRWPVSTTTAATDRYIKRQRCCNKMAGYGMYCTSWRNIKSDRRPTQFPNIRVCNTPLEPELSLTIFGSVCNTSISLVLSVRPSICINTAPTGRIFPKFDTEGLYKKSNNNNNNNNIINRKWAVARWQWL